MNDEYKKYLLQQQNIIKQQQEQINLLLLEQQKKDLSKAQQEPYRNPKKKVKIDPYKILNISKEDAINDNKLTKQYKKLAFQYHPDKNNGDDKKFKLITMAYKLLQKKNNTMKNDKIHNDLKNNSLDYIEEQKNNTKTNIKMKKFNIEQFNKIYDENRINDEFTDSGYGEWLKKEDNIEQVQMTEYNKDKFNNEFQRNKAKKVGSNIQIYEDPKELVCMKNFDSIMTLGSKVKSYTGETNGLQYRDLKEAYEDSTLIDINSVNINNRVTNLKYYDQQRNNISYVMSDDDIQKQVLHQELEKKEELDRIERLKQRDQLYFDQYKKIHKRLIG